MINPIRNIRRLEKNLKKWHPKSDWEIAIPESYSPEDIANQIIYINEEPWIPKGYALISYLIAVGKILQAAESIADFWGDSYNQDIEMARNMDMTLILDVTKTVPKILGIPREFDGYNELVSSTAAIIEASFFSNSLINTERYEENEIYAFDLLASVADAASLQKCVQLYFDSNFTSIVHKHFKEISYSFLDRFDRYEKDNLKYFLRNFQNTRLIFSWVNPDKNEHSFNYLKNLNFNSEDELMNRKINLINEVLENIPAASSDSINRENLIGVLTRIVDAIRETGFDYFSQAVISLRGQSGRNSMVGNSDRINIVPLSGSKYFSCEDICLMVAKGRDGRSILGFKNVMRDLRLHLLRCRNTKLVLMLHDEWDNAAINESRLDLQYHHENDVTFIRLLVNGDEITYVPNIY